jgi:hypothetical protein
MRSRVTAEAVTVLDEDDLTVVMVTRAPMLAEWASSTDLNPTAVARSKEIQLMLNAAKKKVLKELAEELLKEINDPRNSDSPNYRMGLRVAYRAAHKARDAIVDR